MHESIGSRRWFLQSVAAGGALWLAGCRRPIPATPPLPDRSIHIGQALATATSFLLGQQAADGAWRSDHYGPFRDGGALTPPVLRTLLAMPSVPGLESSYRKGASYLASLIKPDGTIEAGPYGLSYPVYTSAGAVHVLSQPCNAVHRKARDAWLAHLRGHQLTEELGWQPADKPFGGWGYSPYVPRRPRPDGPQLPGLPPESNLSATIFALEALRAASVVADDLAFRRALVFVQRCQNYADDPKERDETFDDGGFFFIYDDVVRNKAGVAGKDRSGRERFASYGSTTADGIRALMLCGRRLTDARLAAARDWLEKHFRIDQHPGKYVPEREANRGAVYYYYCCSAAQALQAIGLEELRTSAGTVAWAEALADELIQRQRADGSWANPLLPQREDDPLVATSLAAQALATCRLALTGERVTSVLGEG